MEFALYDKLSKSASNVVADDKNWAACLALLPRLTPEQTEHCYSLIVHHYCRTTGTLPAVIPYSGNVIDQNRNGVKIETRNLPIELQKILISYFNSLLE
jgi:hypothetical protein